MREKWKSRELGGREDQDVRENAYVHPSARGPGLRLALGNELSSSLRTLEAGDVPTFSHDHLARFVLIVGFFLSPPPLFRVPTVVSNPLAEGGETVVRLWKSCQLVVDLRYR